MARESAWPNGFKSGWCCNKSNCARCTGGPYDRFGTICTCDCHGVSLKVDTELAKLAAELGVDLSTLEKPAPEPPVTAPSVPVAASLDSGGYDDTGDTTETPVAAVPPRTERAFEPTKSGRRARGELEYKVYDVCAEWLAAKPFQHDTEPDCTPKYIAQKINEKYQEGLPSVGAIGAIFDRWEKAGWARQAKSPVRFLGFSAEVSSNGLEEVKERAKRDDVKRKAALKRGERV